MPDLTTLTTKALQINTLREIWTHASKRYARIKKQKEKMTVIIRSLNQNTSSQSRGQQYSTF